MIDHQFLLYLYYLLSASLQGVAVTMGAYIMMGWIMIGFQPKRDGPFIRIYAFLSDKIDPIFEYCRQFLPPIMGLDFSPILAFLAIEGVQYLLVILFRILLTM